MRANFRKLAWAFLLILLDIHIFIFDIFPDFIGYLLIISALHKLDRHYSGYKKAWPVALVLCVLSLVPTPPQFSLQQQAPPPSPLWVGITGLHLVLLLVLVFAILSTLTRHASSQGLQELAYASRNRMRFFCFLQLVMLFVTPYSLNTDDAVLAVVALTILLLLAMILIMFLFRKSAKAFAASDA
ncbi:hypothetical protein [Paenibacillus sp. 1P07SE]|uniref:hypothetical protein n=1 Tax=Paenibacillus sp. 1P07SE TaxID=3132209 RepID=UPI0039A5CDBE